MRITVLENDPSYGLGGQELSLLDLMRGLSHRGHEVHLLYNREGSLLPEYRQFCASLTCVGAYSIDHRQLLRAGVEWFRSLNDAGRTRPDVIYCNQYLDTLFGAWLSRRTHAPLVCHLRLPPPGRFCWQWRHGMTAVTSFIAISNATRQAYLDAGFDSEAVSLIYNGIDLERFTPQTNRIAIRTALGIPVPATVVIFAGRFDPVKGLDTLIEAFARLPQASGDKRLLMVGKVLDRTTEGPGSEYVAKLKALSRDLGVEEQVIWTGARIDLPDLFSASDVTALPSRFMEPFGRVLIESMACKTPAIGTRTGGIPEVLSGEFDRFVVPVDDVKALSAALAMAVEQRKKSIELGERCRQHVIDHFSLVCTVDGVEEVIQAAKALGPVRRGPSVQVLRQWGRGI